jgi:hypothetical protein
VTSAAPALSQETIMSNAPISMPLRRETEETWKQVIGLFRKHGLSEPPIRLRDELVVALEWAWHGVALQSAADTPPPVTHVAGRYRHKKRGSEYELIGYGKMQVEDWKYPHRYIDMGEHETDMLSVDMREVAIYRSVDDGSLWVRPREEFEDGRFEAVQEVGR